MTAHLTAQLIALSIITPPLMYFDVRYRRLPNVFTYSYASFGLVLCIVGKAWVAISVALGIGVILGILAISTSAIGLGDVKLIVGLSLSLGSLSGSEVWVALMFAFSLAGVAALGLLLFRQIRLRGSLPMGPFLLVGAWIALLS